MGSPTAAKNNNWQGSLAVWQQGARQREGAAGQAQGAGDTNLSCMRIASLARRFSSAMRWFSSTSIAPAIDGSGGACVGRRFGGGARTCRTPAIPFEPNLTQHTNAFE
jgi:hypothetical protein